MKLHRIVAFTVALVLSSTQRAPAAERDVLVPIDTFVRAVNAGERAAVIATFSPDGTIVDEFAPFRFPAPQAAAHWYDGFGADARANGVTGGVIVSTPPKFISVAGTHAYVVVPAVYTYEIHGKPAKETGSLAFALIERGTRWKIVAMAWAKLADTSIP